MVVTVRLGFHDRVMATRHEQDFDRSRIDWSTIRLKADQERAGIGSDRSTRECVAF